VTAAPSPSVASLRKEFGEAIERHVVSCGDTIVYASRDRVHDVLAWLKDTPGENYNYLTDITAVDYRDPELALEVVWQIRALDRTADLRVKFSLFNVFNMQRVTEVNEDLELEDGIGTPNEFFLQGTDYQSRAYGQLQVSLDF